MHKPLTAVPVVRPGEPYTGDVEIRVHGVSGTPPEELLDRATTERVSGDRIAGFYRPAATQERRDIPRGAVPGTPEYDDAPWLEGYSWGGWTSGAKSRALWLVLAPFALINVAPRMLPPDPASDGPYRPHPLRLLIAALIRVLAASLTCTFVLGVSAPMLTTVARRCPVDNANARLCHGLPAVVSDLLARVAPSGAMGLVTVVPLLLIGLLFYLGRSSARRYETAAASAAPQPGRPDDVEIPLLRTDLWHGGVAVRRLRLLHVQLGVSTIGATIAVLFPASALRTAALVVSGVTLLAGGVLVGLRLSAERDEPVTSRLSGGVLWLWSGVAGSAGLAAALVLAGSAVGADAAGLAPDRLVHDADQLVGWLFKGQALLLTVVALLLLEYRRRGGGAHRQMFMSGFAGFFFALLGWLLGSMMTAAVIILVPTWLGEEGFTLTPGRIAAVLAEHGTWFGGTTRSSGIGMLAAMAVLLILLVQLAVRFALAQRTGGSAVDRATVEADNPGHDFQDAAVAARVRQIGFLHWTARRVDRVPRGMVVFCAAVMSVLAVQLVALTVPAASRPSALAFFLGEDRNNCGRPGDCVNLTTGPVAWGVFLTGGVLIGLLALGVFAYRTAAIRRGVGVFWDLACFWPRDGHPFAPPCYNERIMPEVRTRIAYYVGGEKPSTATDSAKPAERPEVVGPATTGRVVIAGHSQGTVISLAAVLLQPPQVQARLSLMTFGCVLDRLYSRFFPRYFGPAVYQQVADGLRSADGSSRWVNLWRRTDYLGGSLPYPPGSPEVPLRCTDPVFERAPGDVVYPMAGRHSAFWLDPVFQAQIRGLLVEPVASPGPVIPPAGP